MIYLELFFSFLQIGLLSFGGGYAAMPLVEKQVIDVRHWMTQAEFTDIITIDELTPGPIAINAATFVGTKMAGVGGALAATFGCILPSCIIALLMAKLYYKYRSLPIITGALSGLRAMVVALIATTALTLLTTAFFGDHALPSALSDIDFLAVGLFILGFFILRKWDFNPLLVMLGAGVIGLCVYPFL